MFERFFGPSKKTIEQAEKDNARIDELRKENVSDQQFVDEYHDTPGVNHFGQDVERVEGLINDREREEKEIKTGDRKAE